jgi:formamidopyrimidine-DNA glycosylase
MPELPEVETVRRGLAPVMEGRRLARVEQRRPDLRTPFPEGLAFRLTGRIVRRIDRRAKYLLFHLDDGMTMLLHLGMTGSLVVHAEAPSAPGAHDHLLFGVESGPTVVFNDARRFGTVDLVSGNALSSHPLLARLGPEPLDDAFNGTVLARALAGRATPVKAALLDQRVVAGLGNIYVAEALWQARVSPIRPAAMVGPTRAARLAAAIKDVLTRAIAAGGSSLRDYIQVTGEPGYFQQSFRIYGREGEPCLTPGCRGIVRRIAQAGRSSFYCPVCQR